MSHNKNPTNTKGKEKPSSSQEPQEWGISYKNKIIKIERITINEIKATPTHTMGWFEEDLMKAWKHIFPLTPISRELGFLPLTDPAWFNWENPWWNFLSDIPSRKASNILGWRELPLIFRELVLGDLNQPDTLQQRRMLVDQPITTSIMGYMEGRKIIQIFYLI